MSSRLMPPNPGATRVTVSTISSGSLVSRHSGKASTPANSLKSMALPSITGMAASGPMSPSPSTAVPSETTATVPSMPGLCSISTRIVSEYWADGVAATPLTLLARDTRWNGKTGGGERVQHGGEGRRGGALGGRAVGGLAEQTARQPGAVLEE